jgi:hypothetical protein
MGLMSGDNAAVRGVPLNDPCISEMPNPAALVATNRPKKMIPFLNILYNYHKRPDKTPFK